MADTGITLFGFEIKRKQDKAGEKLQSIVPPTDQDGAGYVTAAGAHYGTYVNIGDDNFVKDNLSKKLPIKILDKKEITKINNL